MEFLHGLDATSPAHPPAAPASTSKATPCCAAWPTWPAMRYNPHIKQCAARWQSPERKGNARPLTPKQTVGAAMNQLARQMFGVLKSAQPCQPCQPIAA